jgi:hypothetical protein
MCFDVQDTFNLAHSDGCFSYFRSARYCSACVVPAPISPRSDYALPLAGRWITCAFKHVHDMTSNVLVGNTVRN